MKNLTTSLFFLLLALAGQLASAQTIRRVNNSGISGGNIYADVQSALTASVAGDIIQVEPSGSDYGSVNVDKAVTIVGPGYFLDPTQNAGLQASAFSASISSLSFVAGGAAATVAGLTVGNVNIQTNNVTVQRCNISNLYANYTACGTPVLLTNLNVVQNYISNLTVPCGGNIGVDNMYIANNIIVTLDLPNTCNGGFFNNVVTSYASLRNFFVKNSYFATIYNASGNTLNNNISADTSLGTTANGNQLSVALASVFTLAPGSTAFDAWYQLKSGTNVARAAGQGGVDIGAFGGTTPYKLGGLPAIPAIYQQTETISGNSLNVNLSGRANN